MIQKISNFDKVFNQETELAEMLAKQISNSQTILSMYHRKTIDVSEKASTFIDFSKYFICWLIIILSVINLLINIPGDIKIENNKIKYFYIQRRNDCFAEYIGNNCNTTTSPELIKQCKKLYDCYSSIDKAPKKMGIISFECDLFNTFFFFLSKKSSAFLGFVIGCILYYNLTR